MSTSSLQRPATVVIDGRGALDAPSRGRRRARGTAVPPRVVVLFLLVALAVGGIAVAAVSGLRAFDVRTPSMGTAAPVGSLVLTRPAVVGDLRTGDVITFRPDAGSEFYTHRIDSRGSAGIQTRGDVNAAPDAWLIAPTDVVGHVVVVLPGAGWAARGLPWIVAAVALVWFGTGFLAPGDARSASRLLGAALAVAVVGAVLRPFVAVQLLATSTTADGGVARVVSTGLLPIRASIAEGGSAHLTSGQTAEVGVSPGAGGVFHVASQLELSVLGWAGLGLVCAVPIVVAVLVGRNDVPLTDAETAAPPAGTVR
ncbi:signal peptidase I [Curtobacterium sp. MWU13-2055]|uniref:signal peptidase I n=1 Tax=Curtobacterium sp. MWU13-2055 TaxID=2931928 RepID=UPI00200FCF16|nr:signal peptidase I [Curtobacterium sp. MWU13-2055]